LVSDEPHAADPGKPGNIVAEDEQRRELGEQNEWV